MYTTTFYSFKGGVGRTLALVNVAVQLLRANKSVMIIDFDLEAPGVESHLSEHAEPPPGIVDFILEYISQNKAPDIRDFVHQHEMKVDGEPKAVFVMPAGRSGADYGNRLGSIDWKDLYRTKDGFILMEDLKAQIKERIAPDYLLIDSRTGHTDIGGICTRQLPDAVVMMAYPNEQNREGLRHVAERIRLEPSEGFGRRIRMHFALSRVPTVDDENDVLRSEVSRFKKEIGINNVSYIHHYDSMDLVGQEIFSVTRPKTRLAKEYLRLCWELRKLNMEDREGVVHALLDEDGEGELTPDTLLRDFSSDERFVAEQIHDVMAWYEDIELKYANDAEVMSAAGFKLLRSRLYTRALDFLRLSAPTDGASCVAIATILKQRGDSDNAYKMVVEAFSRDDIDLSDMLQALDVVGYGEVDYSFITNSPSVKSLDDKEYFFLIESVGEREESRPIRRALLRARHFEPGSEVDVTGSRLLLHAIAAGLPDVAVSYGKLVRDHKGDENLTVPFMFNYAVAVWVLSREVNAQFFRRVIEGVEHVPEKNMDPNLPQCLAFAHWCLGDRDAALAYLREAETLAKNRGHMHIFSCWRFTDVSAEEFAKDINAMRQCLNSDQPCLPPIAAFYDSMAAGS